MSGIMCVIDGWADESFSLPKYGGAWGTFATCPPGFDVESYACIATLLGVKAENLPPQGRAYIEALGAGISVGEGEQVLRGSWLALDEQGLLLGSTEPPAKLQPWPKGWRYHSLGGYRALLTLPCGADIETLAPYEAVGQKLPFGLQPLRVGDKALLPWGRAIACVLPTLSIRTALVGEALVVKGLAHAMDIDFYSEACFTADTNTDLAGKARLALELAQRYPLVILHINGADEAAHRRDPAGKQIFLHRVEVQTLAPLLKAGLPLLICGDHGSSPASGLHLGGEQPFILLNTKRQGDLGNLPGWAALDILWEETHG